MRLGQKMTEVQKARRGLRAAIIAWASSSRDSMAPWRVIEDAITLLVLKVRQESATSVTVPARKAGT